MTTITVLAFVVSAFVAFIQYAQWRTANQKVVIDLFDRRLRVFTALRDAIGEISRSGEAEHVSMNAYTLAQVDAEFLFGPEVNDYLEKIAREIASLHVHRLIPDAAPNYSEIVERKYATFNRVTDFYKTAPTIFSPYIGLTQKNTPFWRPWS